MKAQKVAGRYLAQVASAKKKDFVVIDPHTFNKAVLHKLLLYSDTCT